MALTGKLIHEIGFKDIQELIDQKVPEHNGLEYKEQVLHPSLKGKVLEDEKDELLTDIVALANALGGYFVIGIGADQQERAHAVKPISADRAKNIAVQLRDLCAAHIKPAIEGFEVQPLLFDHGQDSWLVDCCNSSERTKAPHVCLSPADKIRNPSGHKKTGNDV